MYPWCTHFAYNVVGAGTISTIKLGLAYKVGNVSTLIQLATLVTLNQGSLGVTSWRRNTLHVFRAPWLFGGNVRTEVYSNADSKIPDPPHPPPPTPPL